MTVVGIGIFAFGLIALALAERRRENARQIEMALRKFIARGPLSGDALRAINHRRVETFNEAHDFYGRDWENLVRLGLYTGARAGLTRDREQGDPLSPRRMNRVKSLQ